jgi:two-component system cell cycle response regulator
MARILVIEDNAANLELMRYLLEAFGHSVTSAVDGELGMDAARQEIPDLILCDVLLPGADGYAVARELGQDERTRAIPIVAVTALAAEGDRRRGIDAGFDGYLAKPIDPETFVAQVDAFLRADLRGSTPAQARVADIVDAATRIEPRARLLVVDDSPTNRELIYQTLSPFGYAVDLAGSVSEAIARLSAAQVPDLILSDLHMPGQDGFNFIRQVKADPRLATLPFLFISSSIWGEGDRETAMRLGVTRFLLRPIEPQALIDEVAACLGGAEKRDG